MEVAKQADSLWRTIVLVLCRRCWRGSGVGDGFTAGKR